MKRYITVDDALNAMCDNCDSVQAICPHYPCKRYTSVERITPADVVEVVRCKDCKYFEHDSVEKINGIPLIVAHEICRRWGNGCKTRENGFCFLAERREDG